MKLLRLTLAISLLIAGSNIWAKGCGAKQSSDDVGMCLDHDLASQKRVLNKLYDKVYAETAAKAELESAQKAWLNYRNKQCGDFVDVDSDHSPSSGVMSLTCDLTLTTDRIEYLKSLN